MNKNYFKEKIKNKKLNVGIIGLGYVGLPLAMTYIKKGFNVYGYDIDINKINDLLNFKNYILDVEDAILFKSIKNKTFMPSNSEIFLEKCDVIFICVPTPITKNRVPDVSYIKSATNLIINNFNKGVAIILKSTTYPGTTEEIIMNAFIDNNKIIDKDYFLAFSPERIDPGNKIWNSDNTPIVVGGVTTYSCHIAKLILESVINKVHTVSNAK